MNTHRADCKRRAPRVLVALALVASTALIASLGPSGTSAVTPQPSSVGPTNLATPGPTTGHPHVGTDVGVFTGNDGVGQTFTAEKTGRVTSVELTAAEHDDPPRVPTAPLTVAIHEVKWTGEPGTLIASESVPQGTFGPTPTTVEISFTTPAVVFDNYRYAIVISTTGICCYGWYGSSVDYTGGEDWALNSGTWATLTAGDGNPDRLFAVHVTPGFVDTLFGSTDIGGDGNEDPYNLQVVGGGSAYAGVGVGPASRPALQTGVNSVFGHLRSPGYIRSLINLQATSIRSNNRIRLGSYTHVTTDVWACGSPGNVIMDHNQRIDGELRYSPTGTLTTPDMSYPFGWSVAKTTQASCGANTVATETLPTFAPGGSDYVGWTTITFGTVAGANNCIAKRTAAACGGVAPSSVAGALGFPGANQSAGLRINVQPTDCGTGKVVIGPGAIPIAGNVHITTKCRVVTKTYTGLSASPGVTAQLVVVSTAAWSNAAIDIETHFASDGAGLSTLLYTTGGFRNRGTAGLNGGGGAIYANRIHLYGSISITRSASLIHNTPTGFAF